MLKNKQKDADETVGVLFASGCRSGTLLTVCSLTKVLIEGRSPRRSAHNARKRHLTASGLLAFVFPQRTQTCTAAPQDVRTDLESCLLPPQKENHRRSSDFRKKQTCTGICFCIAVRPRGEGSRRRGVPGKRMRCNVSLVISLVLICIFIIAQQYCTCNVKLCDQLLFCRQLYQT